MPSQKKNGVPCARLFHGTRSHSFFKILRDGLWPVGGGALEKAMVYTSKAQDTQARHTFLVVPEIFLPRPEQISVCSVDPSSKTACCRDADLYTEYDEPWQFVARDRDFLSGLAYNVWIL